LETCDKGEKLRTCREHKRLHREKLVMSEARKRRLEKELGSILAEGELRKEREDVVALRLMLALVERLEVLILREILLSRRFASAQRKFRIA